MARLANPAHLDIDISGNLLFTDYYNHVIRKIDQSGTITTIAGSGVAGYSGDGGSATAARLKNPNHLKCDQYGNIFIADEGNNVIRKISSSGVITTVAGTGVSGYNGDGMAATLARLYRPTGVNLDASGNLYITDFSNYRIRRVDASGIITTIAGTGASGFSGDGGAATAANIHGPASICFDGAGNGYFADQMNSRIRIITPGGIITTIIGNGSRSYGGDGGAATAASLYYPSMTGFDSRGNILIDDSYNNVIRLVDNAGIISTIAGNGLAGYRGDGVVANSTSLFQPWGIAADTCGQLYIADALNNRIRKVNYSSVINGITNLCVGATSTLTNILSGGVWSSSNTSVISVGSSSGTVTALATGISIVSYQLTSTCGTISAITTVTVSPAPTIAGPVSVCAGSSVSLISSTPGGTWYSGSTSIATIGSATGVFTGIGSGLSIITYTPVAFGCGSPTTTVIVSASPAAISGNSGVCLGLQSSLSNAIGGGIWSCANVSVATIGSLSGVVTGVAIGTSAVSYVLSSGCHVVSALTVNPLPLAILGANSICVGSTSTLLSSAGGMWSSSNTSVALIDAAGVVTASTAGNTIISYSLPTGCAASTSVQVNPNPMPIIGITSICPGLTTTLSNSTVGGVWSSGSSFVSTVGSSSGIVTGNVSGISTISYQMPLTGCVSTAAITIVPFSPIISGPSVICSGDVTTLSNAVAGGIWGSGTGMLVSVDSVTGTVTGISPGVTNVSYLLPAGCLAVTSVTVLPIPSPITGTTNVCAGLTTTLSNAVPGGLWSSPGYSWLVTVGSSSGSVTGLVAGLSANTATITYALRATGCKTTTTVTVNPVLLPITGMRKVCVGAMITLNDATPGGSWSCSNTAASIVASTGILTGIDADTVTISYTLPIGCIASTVVTVNPAPAAISGPANLCFTLSVTLSNATNGGFWSSSGAAIILPTTGIATGGSLGTARITYSLPTGCYVTSTIVVAGGPPPITGPLSICAGDTTTLSNVIGGGTWISSVPGTASVGYASGIVLANVGGTSNITYSLGGGCRTISTVTINPLPPAIVGITSICTGNSTSLSNRSAGGVWSSSDTIVATIDFIRGAVVGLAAGTAVISYTEITGCARVVTLTISNPSFITGMTTLCVGASSSLSNPVTGGTWISAVPAIATIGSATGVVTGVAPGTSAVTYITPSGCTTTTTITISSSPSAISGSSTVCTGQTISLSNNVGGGLWSSASSSVLVGSSGVVTGASAGTAIVTYSLGSGCIVYHAMTVNLSPSAITGTSVATGSLCTGATSTLSNATAGGAWSVTGAGSGSLGSGGAYLVTGIPIAIGTGIATISYTISGCSAQTTLTIIPMPASISGPSTICTGTFATLSNSVAGGNWSISGAATGSPGGGGYIVTGTATGSATVMYSTGNGCSVTKTLTVLSMSAITGNTTMCVGSSVTLSIPIAIGTSSGTWSSGLPGIAAIGSATGVVNGLSPGTAIIAYASTVGCTATTAVTVSSPPPAITGTMQICPSQITTLSNSASGGTWSLTGSGAGSTLGGSYLVTGTSSGTALVTYSLGVGCTTTATVTINSLPPSITGPGTVCVGNAVTLSNATPGGTWSVIGGASGAITGAGYVLIGTAQGTAIVTYTAPTGCTAQRTATVNPLPAINGANNVCTGSSITLSGSPVGGTWSGSSGIVSITTLGPGIAAVTGSGSGTTTVIYTISTGCTTSTTITVGPLPPTVAGSAQLCAGGTSTLSNTASGTWSASGAYASIGTFNGVVNGIAVGTEMITFHSSTGCSRLRTVTVIPLPVISGSSNVCVGSVITLSGGTLGAWTGTSSVATVGIGSGTVTGLTTGTASVTFTALTGCVSSFSVTVDPLPASIAGAGQICGSQTLTLSNSTAGGSWISGSPGIATVGSATGIVTGLSGGHPLISYSVGGCFVFTTVTVNPLPAPITGADSVCAWGGTVLVHDADAPLGSWSSFLVSIDTTGLVTGFSPGVGSITYTLPSGCSVTTTIAIKGLPFSITGPSVVCSAASISLADASPGGTWSIAGASGIATVTPTAGVVTGISTGFAVVTYTIPQGACTITKTITVNPQPATIIGASALCAGTSVTLSEPTAGGTWSSGATSIVSIGSAGIVNGISAGIATVTYSINTACGPAISTHTMLVNPLPVAGSILGAHEMCVGNTITLSATTSGGAWSITNPKAAVSAGVVAGILTGADTVIYAVSNSCGTTYTTHTITLISAPSIAMITGPATVCEGAQVTLSSNMTGGTWNSDNTSVASVSATGLVTGISNGTSVISYTLTNVCGSAVSTHTLGVNPLPFAGAIYGTTSLCVGATATLAENTTGGTWSITGGAASMNVIDNTTNVLTGVVAGTSLVTYKVTNICGIALASQSVVVKPIPDAGTITGPDSICIGDTATFSNTQTGGNWSSTNGSVATVPAPGTVIGVAPGTTSVVYATSSLGCNNSTEHLLTVRSESACTDTTVVTMKGIGCTGGGKINVFPNPAHNGEFSIALQTGYAEDANIIVVNALGQRIYKAMMQTNSTRDASLHVAQGVYTVVAITAHNKCIEKVTVTK